MYDDKISIIIPAYNVEKWLPRCLDSVLNQTYKNIEIIVVDDGSKDNTKEVMLEYAKKDSRIINVFKENGGVTSARLAGFEKSTGDWIGFVDSDDEIESYMYKFLLDNAIKYNADISHCGYKVIHSDGRNRCFYNTGIKLEQNSSEAIKELLSGDRIEPGITYKIFKRELFIKSNIENNLDNSIRVNEDLLFNYILFSEAKKIVYEDKCPYHYMSRSDSASRQINEKSILDPIKVKEYILNNSDDKLIKYARNSYIATCVNSYNGIINKENKKLKNIFESIRKRLIENKRYFKYLNSHIRTLALMIVYTPHIYPLIYNFYVKHFQENKYY